MARAMRASGDRNPKAIRLGARHRRGGAKIWLAMLTDPKNRGINDVFFLIRDGLNGIPDVGRPCGH